MAQSLYRVVVTDPETNQQSYKRNSAKWNAVNETALQSVKVKGLIVNDIQVLDSNGEYVSDPAAMAEFRSLFNGKVSSGNPVMAYDMAQFAELCKTLAKDLKKSDLTDEDLGEFVSEFAKIATMLSIPRDYILKATK